MSQLDSYKKEIDGHQFEIFKLDPMVSLDLVVEITNALAPAIGGAVDSLSSNEEAMSKLLNDQFTELGIGSVIEKLLKSATNDRVKLIVNTFRKVTHIDGKPLDATFDVVFRGDMGLLIKWLGACLQGEWGNALEVIKGAIGRVLVTMSPQQSESQSILNDLGRSQN